MIAFAKHFAFHVVVVICADYLLHFDWLLMVAHIPA